MHFGRKLILLLHALSFLILPLEIGRTYAGKLDVTLVKNDDPRAVPRGLYFHSSVPLERRKLIIDDLLWLGQLGPLTDSESLADLLSIKQRPLTGAMLVAWLIERMVVVSVPRAVGHPSNGTPVIISNARPDLGLLLFDARKKDREGKSLAWEKELIESAISSEEDAVGLVYKPHRFEWRPNHNWRTADIAYDELDAWRIDGHLLIATDGAYANPAAGRPAVYLTDRLFADAGTRRPSDRIVRLAVLFHEARHLDGTHSGDAPDHSPCQKDSWQRVTNGLRLGGQKLVQSPLFSCDWHYAGAYGIDAVLIRTLAQNCPICTGYDLDKIKDEEEYSWSRVQFRLRTPVTIPDLPVLHDEPGWAGKTLAAVPPLIYFTALAEGIDSTDRRIAELFQKYTTNQPEPSEEHLKRQQVEALAQWIRDLDRQGLVDPDQPVSRWSRVVNDDSSAERRARPDPDEANAMLWLQAVRTAESEGYNVPLVWMPSCAKFRNGCGAHATNEPPTASPPPVKPRPSGWLGVKINDVDTAAVAQQYDLLKTTRGVIVASVTEGSPAQKDGLEVGDLILEVDGQEVTDSWDLAQKIATAGSSEKVELAYCNPRGAIGFKYITLDERPAELDTEAQRTAEAASPALSPSQAAGPSLWNHNGSTMKLVADGPTRHFYYVEPRQGMREQGVTSGTLLFEGEKRGDRFSGTAYIFSERCGRSGYRVAGDVALDQKSVILRGQAPRLNEQCEIFGYKDDHLLFEYLAAEPAAESRPSFDCATNHKPSEVVVCRDAELSRLDVEMAALFQQALEARPEPGQSSLRQDQREWLGRRNQCGEDVACLKRLYFDRIATLKTPAPAHPSRQTYTVSSSASGGVLNIRRGPGQGHSLVVGIPIGAMGIERGTCRAADDGRSRHDWCEVEWQGFRGWASNCCLEAE